MNNRELYQSKEFADAWHKYQSEKPDVLRIKMMNRIMEKSISNLKGKVVLDIGCGNGFFIPNLLKKHPKKIIAVDISRGLLKYAEHKFKNKNVEFKQMDLTKRLNLKTNSIDVIVCYNVLQETEDISRPLEEMKRVLRPGGKLVFSVIHALYNLFVNDIAAQKENVLLRLGRYTKTEKIKVRTIKRFENFIVCRRPISKYINEILKNKLILKEIKEIPIDKKIAKIDKKYLTRIGIPVFLLFKCSK